MLAARAGWRGHGQSPGRVAPVQRGPARWDTAVGLTSAPRATQPQATGAAETFYAGINCPAIAVVFPVSSDS